MVTIGTQEEEKVFINNYSNLVAVLKPGFKNMIPHFVSKQIINPDETSLENLLKKIATCLKEGDAKHFYNMLHIMKYHGNLSVKELADRIENELSS